MGRCARIVFLIVLAYTVSIATVAAEPGQSDNKVRQLVLSDRPLVIAHRGDSSEYPENTQLAFEAAVKAGCDLVELDYHVSADAELVVIHDATLDRTTNAREVFGGQNIPVKSKTWAELSRLDAGKWFNPKFAGTRLCTLEQALDTIQRGSITLIERKSGDAPSLIALLRRKGLVNQVVVHAFDWRFLAECHVLEPELLLEALGEKRLSDEKIAEVKKTGAIAVGWEWLHFHVKSIRKVREAGLRAWVWTMNDPDRAGHLIQEGMCGLITDVPKQVKTAVADLKVSSP